MAYVADVPYRITAVGDPWTEITEMIDYSRAYADAMRLELTQAIEDLEDAVQAYTPDFGNVTSDIPELETPVFPDAPDLSVQLNENWPANDTPDPNIQPVDVDISYDTPIKPDSIDPVFTYVPGAYSSCTWSQLCALIQDELVNGGNGLSELVYGLIIDRNLEARRNLEDQARQRMYDAVGARGFDLPGGMAAAAILEFEKDITAKDLDAVNSTTIKDFEIADANTRFVKELALKMDEAQRAAYNSEEDRLFNIAKSTQEVMIAIYEQNVKLYIAEWEGVKAQIEVAVAEIDALIATNDSEIKVFLGKTEAYKVETEAIASENKSKTDLAIAEGQIYETEVRAISAKFSVLVEEVRVALEEYKVDVGAVISKEEINLKAFTTQSELTISSIETISNIAGQAVASALGMLNTGMSYDYAGRTSMSYTSGLSNQKSETHAYKHE